MNSLFPSGAAGFRIAETNGYGTALFSEFVFILIFAACLVLDTRRFWRAEVPSRGARATFAAAAACVLALWWYVAANQMYLSKLKFHLVFPLAALFELPGLLLEAKVRAAHFSFFPLAFCYACAATYFQPPYWWASMLLTIVPLGIWTLENRYVLWSGHKPRSHFD